MVFYHTIEVLDLAFHSFDNRDIARIFWLLLISIISTACASLQLVLIRSFILKSNVLPQNKYLRHYIALRL